MVYSISDNLEIINLLEKSGNDLLNFQVDNVLFFEFEKQMFLVLYSAGTRNFKLYAAESSKTNVNGLIDFLFAVQEDESELLPVALKEQGLKLLEHEIHSQQANRFYFDAH